MLIALLGLHAALAVIAAVTAQRLGRAVFLLAGLAPLSTVVVAAWQAPRVLAGEPVVDRMPWAPSLNIELSLRLDAFALLMVGLVSGIGVLVFVFAYGYFAGNYPKLGSFSGSLTAFAGSMLGLVLADNLLLVFVFWELTSITSFLLIGYEDRKKASKDAAQQALLTTGVGGLALLGGVILIGQSLGSYSLSELAGVEVASSPVLVAGLVLVLAGAFTKSAQAPFHTWLPGAMAAPTPVSAYLHSATMVKAGVYLVARLAPVFALVAPWRSLVVGFGLVSMLIGGYRALRQHDLKLLLAYGTVSQLGFLTVLFGLGTGKATFAATTLILAHGLFKAALFMVVGVIDKKAGTRDLRRLAGLRDAMPLTLVAGTIAAASMAGLPPLLGFIAKEAAYESLLEGGADVGVLSVVAIVGIVTGSILTFAYSARFVAAIWGRSVEAASAGAGASAVANPVQPPVDPAAIKRPAAVFAAPALLLAVGSVLLGLLPLIADNLVNAAATALDPRWEGAHLELWHGFNLALALSGVTVAAGGGLYLQRRRVAALQDAMPAVPGAKEAYDGIVAGLLAGSKRLTARVQNGSLPTYQTVILLAVLLLPGSALVRTGVAPQAFELSAGWGQAVVAGGVSAAALAAVWITRRFAAVLVLGAVGYGVALLFVVQGAPDLALTQLLIETLAVVIFVLVLHHLPPWFSVPTLARSKVARASVAIGVGVFVTAFALVAGGARTAEPISAEYLARAYPEAQGRNVVNVILVDFRALDTLGEIVVLAVAALGISAMLLAARLDRKRRAAADERAPATTGERVP